MNYLADLLGAEMEERERHKIERRIKEARLPRMETLEDFDFSAASHISVKQIHMLAEGSYLERAESVILIGDSGAGKTRLASGLCLAACKRKKRARFVTAAAKKGKEYAPGIKIAGAYGGSTLEPVPDT